MVCVRTIVYIDGFNLYYGACCRVGRKWLDLSALCARLLPNDQICEIAYCTANVKKDPDDLDKQNRQRIYHRALKTIPNLKIYLGRFVGKEVKGDLLQPPPPPPKGLVDTYEEKGTDVNLASRLLKDAHEGRFESAAVISNDGDLKMPVKIVRADLGYPVTIINPVLDPRKPRSAALSPNPLPQNARFIQMRASDVKSCQFPAELRSPKGRLLVKPPTW